MKRVLMVAAGVAAVASAAHAEKPFDLECTVTQFHIPGLSASQDTPKTLVLAVNLDRGLFGWVSGQGVGLPASASSADVPIAQVIPSVESDEVQFNRELTDDGKKLSLRMIVSRTTMHFTMAAGYEGGSYQYVENAFEGQCVKTPFTGLRLIHHRGF